MAAGENYNPSIPFKLNPKIYTGMALVSAVYFTDILVKGKPEVLLVR